MPQKYFTIEGVATYLHHTGTTTLPGVAPDQSRGESVLCLHGVGGNGAVFAPFMQRLAKNHSPLAFDQPGHGRSGGLDSLGSVERMTDFTRAVIEKLDLRQPVLLGHSLGSAIALEYALRYPQEVRALVLCSSGARLEILDSVLDLHRRVTEGRERRPFSRELFSAAASPEILRQGFMEDMKTDPRARFGDMLAARDWNADKRLDALAAPTLIVWGEDEQPALAAQAELLSARLRSARKLIVPKAGHMLPLEAPEALAGGVDRFLADLAR